MPFTARGLPENERIMNPCPGLSLKTTDLTMAAAKAVDQSRP